MNAAFQSKRDRAHPGGVLPAETLSLQGAMSGAAAELRRLEEERDRLAVELALSRPIIADLALNPFASIAELRQKARIALVEMVD